ncbi:MAG: EVE domain-containing protein, partial [Ekhidna sp.]
DPTTEDHRWYVMDVVPLRKLRRPVSLAEVKSDERLESMQLVTHSRLSVQSVTHEEFDIIIEMSEN